MGTVSTLQLQQFLVDGDSRGRLPAPSTRFWRSDRASEARLARIIVTCTVLYWKSYCDCKYCMYDT